MLRTLVNAACVVDKVVSTSWVVDRSSCRQHHCCHHLITITILQGTDVSFNVCRTRQGMFSACLHLGLAPTFDATTGGHPQLFTHCFHIIVATSCITWREQGKLGACCILV
jgi:hypothetical protein